MSNPRVDRCACINRTFADLLAYGSVEAAQKATGCGRECGGCLPYLRLAFETGETDFDLKDPRLGDSS